MRIISCYIAGFGRLKEYSMDLKPGLNAFVEENGWGKTTFSVFIKAMFYGMEYSRRRQLSEREHYMPWDGGTYGGSLVFEKGDKTYRIERTFGASDKSDTFTLYDNITGKESDDYSSNIGEELFAVDRASFEKSIFMPQADIKTEMTDSMNAKMGDMSFSQDDINNFDLAIKRLKDARTVYTRNSKVNPGRLMQTKHEIASCREALEQVVPLAEGYEKQQEILEEKRVKLEELMSQKDELSEAITSQSKREQELGKYREKRDMLEKYEKEREKLAEFFDGGVPTREELSGLDEIERQLQFDITHLDAALDSLPEPRERERLEELFKDNPVTQDDIDRWEDQAQKVLTLRVRGEHTRMDEEDKKQLADLKYFFSKHVPDAEELAAAEQSAANYVELSGKVKTLEEQYRDLNEKSAKTKSTGEEFSGPGPLGVFLTVGLVLAMGAAAFFIFDNRGVGFWLGVGCAVTACIVIVYGIANALRKHRERKNADATAMEEIDRAREVLDNTTEERDKYLSECKAFLENYLVTPTDSYLKMVSEIQRKADLYQKLETQEEKLLKDAGGALDELATIQTELYTQLSHYAMCYGYDLYESHEESEVLQRMASDLGDYNRLESGRKVEQELAGNVKEGKETLFAFIQKYPVNEPTRVDHLKENLLYIRKKRDSYYVMGDTISNLRDELAEFEKESDIRSETESVEDLQEKQKQLDEQIAELNSQITKNVDDLSEISEELESLEEHGERLPVLIDREREYKQIVERYDKTIGYLQQAREQFLTRYMGPLRHGLRRYLAMIFNDNNAAGLYASDFTLDMDLGVRLSYHGATHEAGYLSAGFCDLASFCARVALIDVLYQKERPVIILDDPFANMDAEKIEQALGLVKRIAGESQVIYFTCHESRKL